MLSPTVPALALAPMDGITDAPMRALQGELGAFTYAVSEFQRVSVQPLPPKVFLRAVPELLIGGQTPTSLPVQVQILGGDPEKMALSAIAACKAGATAIDINFGCPAPTVNRNDGGASILRYPCRIRDIVSGVRAAVPSEIPVSAKLRLGWDSVDSIYENAAMAAEGGASWLTIHARTRMQGYAPPVFWKPIGIVRETLKLPVVANGDIWDMDDFHRCQNETGCIHFMLGRSALADPSMPHRIADDLGIVSHAPREWDWTTVLTRLVAWTEHYEPGTPHWTVKRLKQWLKFAAAFGDFTHFDAVKRTETLDDFFSALGEATEGATMRLREA